MDEHLIQRVVCQSFEQEGANVPPQMIHRIANRITALIENMNKPITRKECAKVLGVSLPTLDRYIRDEGIPYRVKNTNASKRVHYIFFREEVIEWQKSRLSDLRQQGRRSA